MLKFTCGETDRAIAVEPKDNPCGAAEQYSTTPLLYKK